MLVGGERREERGKAVPDLREPEGRWGPAWEKRGVLQSKTKARDRSSFSSLVLKVELVGITLNLKIIVQVAKSTEFQDQNLDERILSS